MNRRESLALWGSGTIAWKGAGGLRDCSARPAAEPLAHMLGDEPLPRNDIEGSKRLQLILHARCPGPP